MNILLKNGITLSLLAALLFASCSKEKEIAPNPAPPPPPPSVANKPPVANAGSDTIIVLPVNQLTVDGSASSDPDGSIIAYQWNQISGPTASSLSNTLFAKAIVTSLRVGTYQFELTVIDNGGLSAKDTVRVNVVDDPTPPGLSGKEFVFDDLTWNFWDGGGVFDEIYLITPARPDLFANAPGLNYNLYIANAEVYLKLDAASDWTQVKSSDLFNSTLPVQYLYIISAPILIVNVWPVSPLNHQLVGTKASVKVKFL